MGTYDGLNRYDGSQLKIFRNKIGDSSSLPHNYIYSLCEDKDYHLWVGTGQGTAMYNPITGRFSTGYYISTGSKLAQKMLFNASVIKSDEAGNVFVGSNGWVF